MIYTNLNNSGEVEAVYAAKRATTTGMPPLLYSSKGYDLEDFLISGETLQDGTPMPEAPVDVVGCGERTAQLLDTYNNYFSKGYIDSYGNFRSDPQDWVGYSGYIEIKPNVVYTISPQTGATVAFNAFYDSSKQYLSSFGGGGQTSEGKYTGISPSTAAYIRISSSSPTRYPNARNKLMLNEGSTALPYEPYGYYKIPVTCGGVTQNIYLGEVPTTRNIKKLVLDGTENWILSDNNYFSDIIDNTAKQNIACKCTHLISDGRIYIGSGTNRLKVYSSAVSSVAQNVDEWKAFLANQYAAGTPVTVWYVLAEPEIGIVNEPLMKIGGYADTISLSQSGITVSTTAGTNTITTETTVLPSSISVTTPEKEVAEIYADINYQNPVYYKSRTLTDTSPLTFKGLGQPLSGYQIYGNMTQNGKPTPDGPIYPQECGDLTAAGAYAGKYAVPITCGGETKTVYLDEPLRKIGNHVDEIDFKTGTVTRRVRKVELTGSETINESSGRWIVRAGLINSVPHIGKSTHFSNKPGGTVTWFDNAFSIEGNSIFFGVTSMFVSMNAFRQLLTDSYTDGNPVTVYYASTRPITEAVTLPQISTISGQNTLSFGTALQPSSVSVTGHIKPETIT